MSEDALATIEERHEPGVGPRSYVTRTQALEEYSTSEITGHPRFCDRHHQEFRGYETRTVRISAVLPDGVVTDEVTLVVKHPGDGGTG